MVLAGWCRRADLTNRTKEMTMAEREAVIPEGQQRTYDRFHFAPAFRVGDTIHVSGVIGVGADGKLPGTPAAEFANVFAGLATTLEAAGAAMSDIVDMTSFHTDLPDSLGEFMAAKDAAIAEPYPAWTAIGCTALAMPGALVEVKVTAIVDGAES
jgi:enamine deaminase RidA (YjgF/YER057c/UK114 family)